MSKGGRVGGRDRGAAVCMPNGNGIAHFGSGASDGSSIEGAPPLVNETPVVG